MEDKKNELARIYVIVKLEFKKGYETRED